MAVITQVSTQVRRFAAMSALVAGGFGLQVAFADHYVAAPLVQALECVRAGTPVSAGVAVRPHFEEEIVVTAPTRHAPRSSKTSGVGSGHAARTTQASPAQTSQAAELNCGARAAEAAL